MTSTDTAMPQQWIPYAAGYAVAINLLLFFCMAIDKSRARRERWRIPEKTLFMLALLGGACGGLLGMRLFRHKTKKPAFTVGFTALLLVQLAAVLWLYVNR